MSLPLSPTTGPWAAATSGKCSIGFGGNILISKEMENRIPNETERQGGSPSKLFLYMKDLARRTAEKSGLAFIIGRCH